MRKIKKIAMFMVFAMIASLFTFSPNVFAADASIKVQFFNKNTSADSNTIAQCYKISNTTSAPLDLSTIKVRYYYTEDGNQDQSFWCDSSQMMNGYSYTPLTDEVTYSIVKMDTPVDGADHYIEVGFKADAGQLEAGGSVEIQARTSKADWSNYNQADDYSFNATSSQYSDWNKVTGYVNGTLEYGVEPTGSSPVLDSTVTPTSGTFDKNIEKQADIPVTMTLNGNTLTSIVNGSYALVEGTDYTVSNNVVTLSKSYLATLKEGTSYSLVFNFSAGKAATFTLNVTDTTVPVVTGTTFSIGTMSGKPGDKVVIPVSLKGISSAIAGCQFNINYDPSLLQVTDVEAGSNVNNSDLNFAYKDFSDNGYVRFVIANLSLKSGTDAVDQDGDVAYITFTIKSTAAIGKTPITFSDSKFVDVNEKIVTTTNTNGSISVVTE